MVKAVIFDLDDTLLWDKKSVKEAFRETCLEAKRHVELDPNELEEAVRAAAKRLYSTYETYDFTQMIGINPFEGLWGDFTDKHHLQFRKMKDIVPQYRKDTWTEGLAAIGIDNPTLGATLAELFPKKRRSLPFVYKDTFSVLNELKNKYQLILLTNGSPTLQNEKLDLTPQLVPYFDHIVVSGAFGRGKPDPAIFQHCLFLTNLTANDAIMVGDNVNTDILGSNRVGMKNVWINQENNQVTDPEKQPTFEIQSLSELPQVLQTVPV
ncbi:HAD-IA family hydrolase [Alkalihalobacillus sp. LMS39]|uniref:HAD family hydrolase n=1 Tax=Alkalihalobacillus sp. LMS39 TaxID=2924032 RepID=UPI001FB4A641|nr:HAD-IA family hydrolase [Alkalihalobacillus sp. LMS39]UOE92593.1 HAD-IA family hydrolase [Alkalihalobacillus sp. LMS39]